MCGICGLIAVDHAPVEPVQKMNRALIHRGPSSEGTFEAPGVSLAMRRLTIIDLNHGSQPIFNEDRSLTLVCNGEIYNYIELRKQLKDKGHRFSTGGDVETIIHLYEEYGTACVDHLRGMFAFCIWDNNKKTAFIARDRMGEKPLYLYQHQDFFLFSSELHSIMASGLIPLELDPEAIDMFFHYHYVPEPRTPIKGITKLPAGHHITIDQKTFKTEQKCYWEMEDAPVVHGDPVEAITACLEELSKLIIRADVPIGVALSGGVDSAMIAAFASKYYKGNIHAFTVGYEGRPESDERAAAKEIAGHLGMPFYELELSDRQFTSAFPRLCGATDDPIADISAFGYFSVSQAAHAQGVPVLLQGQGGDELFWGYKWVRENHKYLRLKNERASLLRYYRQKFSEKNISGTYKQIAKGVLSFGEARALQHKHNNEQAEIFPFYDFFPGFNGDYNFMYGEAMQGQHDATKPFHVHLPWKNPEVTLTRLISSTYLLENGIAQGDRLSMANSVELRLPFVDYRLVETVVGLRKAHRDIDLPPKHWLAQIGKKNLPAWVFENRKRGFEPPVEKWMNLLLQHYGQDLAEGELVKKGILKKSVAAELAKGRKEPQVIFPAFFNGLVLEQWLRSFK